MTTQQITMAALAAAGTVLFFAGRYFAEKFSSDEPGFIPATMVTARGAASYIASVVSWAGLVLAAACLALLFT